MTKPKGDPDRNEGEITMKLKVKRASDPNFNEEWNIETLSGLFEKAREQGDIIVHNPDDVEWRNCDITIFDDYLD